MPPSKQRPHDPGEPRASAPYNFVPLPESWLPAGPEQQAADHDSYLPDRCSGYIDFSVRALTPLYVRGTLTPDERAAGENSQVSFFQPAGKLRIPGSTLRGMVRNLVEIISQSRVLDAFDSVMHYRTFDGSALSDFYGRDMVSRGNPGGAYGSKIRAGYLELRRGTEREREYWIQKVQPELECEFFRVEDNDARAVFASLDPWTQHPIWFIPVAAAAHPRQGPPLWFAKVTRTNIQPRSVGPTGASTGPVPGPAWREGWLIASGQVAGKHRHWIVGPRSATANDGYRVPGEAVEHYQAGGAPAEVPNPGFRLLPSEVGRSVPCFYQLWGNGSSNRKRGEIRFGHTGMFRLPYQNVPAKLFAALPDDGDQPGLAEQMFGSSGDQPDGRAGSLCFEDAFLHGKPEDWQDGTARQPLVLGSPHPTCFPHYVCQDLPRTGTDDQGRPLRPAKQLRHWDSAHATPRGSKLYWHRSPEDPTHLQWYEQPRQPGSTVHPPDVRVVKPGATFAGRIRFDNLTPVQLGAVLFALALPGGRAHKLGMGKPLGLGSVRAECTLWIIDRRQRYDKILAAADAWHELRENSTERIPELQDTFAAWVLGREDATREQLWREPRMADLDAMLHFDTRPVLTETRYLRGPDPQGGDPGEYRRRWVLPAPSGVNRRAFPPSAGSLDSDDSRPPTAPPESTQSSVQNTTGSATRPAPRSQAQGSPHPRGSPGEQRVGPRSASARPRGSAPEPQQSGNRVPTTPAADSAPGRTEQRERVTLLTDSQNREARVRCHRGGEVVCGGFRDYEKAGDECYAMVVREDGQPIAARFNGWNAY